MTDNKNNGKGLTQFLDPKKYPPTYYVGYIGANTFNKVLRDLFKDCRKSKKTFCVSTKRVFLK